MSAPRIQTSFDNPAPEECPANVTDLVALLNELVHSELLEEFIPYVTGADTPAVEDQDKVWHRTDPSGRPIGTYVFYSGTWRKQYTQPLGTIAMFAGDPAIYFSGSNHKGAVGGEWDGWQLCNGLDGTPNLSDKFIVAAKLDDLGVGYPTGGPWQTSVEGSSHQSGGAKDFTLDSAHTFQPPVSEVKVGQWHADGNAPGVSLYGLPNGAGDVTLQPSSPGVPTPTPVPTLPPYYALAYAIFVGY